MNDLESLVSTFKSALQKVSTLAEFEALTINYTGRNGIINQQFKKITEVAADQRKAYGAKLNKFKTEIETALGTKKTVLMNQVEKTKKLDTTLPGTSYPTGSLHMVTLAVEEITKIFERIGFIRMSYPEVEWEHFAFETLNMPADHPARDDFETFFVKAPPSSKYGKMVLTPHTSNGQNREMLRLGGKPPIRMINISKTYRPNYDPSHTPMFHQFEGMCIDKDINITHLKGTIDYYAKSFFGPDRETRLRPYHFQFTEPSFEVDISCGVCNGTGILNGNKCRLCKSGWLELGGSGMMHRNVLKAGGIDPDVYSGWAFGFGVERNVMMKEDLKLDDIRVIYDGDIRFLEQF